MCIVAYVSGHGFGHAARETEILRRLPPDIPLVIKSVSPEWFWRETMGERPFTYIADTFDCGCVQLDSIRIDIPATLTAWLAIDARNQARRAEEIAYLREVGARVVISDVASFPLTLADKIGIPGILVANFTWVDIYEAFIAKEPEFEFVVDQLDAEYRATSLCLETGLSLPMPYLERRESVGIVSRPGRDRRAELLSSLDLPDSGERLALIYLGAWGYPIPYERLESFTGWRFLSLQPSPVPVANWSVVPAGLMAHPDLVASVDLVVSKPGYGIIGECLSQGTPFLYCPRPSFAEYSALETVLTEWPGGRKLAEESFLALDWNAVLAAVPPRGSLTPLPTEGGPRAADRITEIYRFTEKKIYGFL